MNAVEYAVRRRGTGKIVCSPVRVRAVALMELMWKPKPDRYEIVTRELVPTEWEVSPPPETIQ